MPPIPVRNVMALCASEGLAGALPIADSASLGMPVKDISDL